MAQIRRDENKNEEERRNTLAEYYVIHQAHFCVGEKKSDRWHLQNSAFPQIKIVSYKRECVWL